MRFFIRKRRQVPPIIIVALIDVLIVLLIFLLVTTQFKHQPALTLALPESSQALKTGANEAAPLVVSIDAEGGIRFGLEARPMTSDRLASEFAAEAAKRPGVKLAINADKNAPVGQLIRVRDAALKANIKSQTISVKQAKQP